ncbi:MAG: alanine racemase [Gemmatimonadota bacterium]
MSTERATRAWIEVRPAALRANLRRVRAAVGEGVRLIPMIKANAYGLGMGAAAAALDLEDPWAFGVATVDEGRELRALGVQRRILVFSPPPPGALGELVAAGLTPALSDLHSVELLQRAAAGHRVPFHIEIDTGMGRAGFDWRTVADWGPVVLGGAHSGIHLEGCFTHLHSADEPDLSSAREQWGRFREALARLGPPDDVLVHACNSAGALRLPEYAAGGVRPGIFLYGGRVGEGAPPPQRVATVRARVLHVRDAPPGTTQGYGATYAAAGAERWATLGIGYGDGLPRALGNRGSALVDGVRVPIVGRISMDMTVVDITGVPSVRAGAVATLLGRDGQEEITLEEVAGHAGTISYEVLTGLTARLPRIWIEDGGD